jgi:PAS domain S-box-containing protein
MEQATDVAGTLGSFEPPRVLVVDDNPSNLTVFKAILSDDNFELVTAKSGVEAMRELLNNDFAAILLDINMPTMDGIQTARLIRERQRSSDVPIIFITAYQPDQAQVLARYASGAADYLVKPVQPEILQSKVRIFVDLFRKTRPVEWQARQLRATNARLQKEVAQREAAQRDAAFEREERQRVTLASIADAVFSMDAKGIVSSLNPPAEQLSGWESALAKGRPWSAVLGALSEPGQQMLEDNIERALSGDQLVRSAQAVALHTRNGQRYIEYAASPVHDRLGDVIGAVLVVRDVTARQRMENERSRALEHAQEARAAAEQANRARDEFLSVISHELRTPLHAIVGWTHILRTNGGDERYVLQATEAIHRSAMAQKKLIEDLLDMSRIINGKIDLTRYAVDLPSVVQAAVDTLRPGLEEKSIDVKCEMSVLSGQVVADRFRLEQVVLNVLSNAIKFTPSGGHVQVQLQQADDSAKLVISDDGQGIPAAFLPYVFEAFRQVDSTTTRRQGGLGLGLAIAKQLVSMHGGQISAHSEGSNRGTTVTIELPMRAPGVQMHDIDDEPPLLSAPLPPTSNDLHGIRILIVDDDSNTLTLLAIALRGQGAHVSAAANAAEALQMLQTWGPQILLSDISMPGEDGYSLIRRVRAVPGAAGKTVALALTAMAAEEDRLRALEAGFQQHIAKPFELTSLIQSIVQLTQAQHAADRA